MRAAETLCTPLEEKVRPAVGDRQDFQVPDCVQLDGWVGGRIAGNAAQRLVKIDPARLLEGYRTRPGRQTWDGEHVGKWLHAATLAWVYTRDPALRAKLDATAAALAECQLADGYLGTYLEKDRWTAWDVWAHKYNLIGLLTYMRYTGNTAPLTTCRRMADMLCRNLGDGPGQRDIVTAGRQHMGMASTSVLEPMVLLYRLTGEKRYLDFCHYIIRAWEQPNGPHIISRLLELKRVDKVANGKAYEMLSCLNGALELYRTEGDPRLLEICLNAWQDIVDKRLYVTGAASIRELFRGDFELPNVDNVGETCVTVTWLQFNAQLLRLTGKARFAQQLEHVVLNQLLGAQRPDGAGWGYYVQMEGRKPYSSTLDGHCCLSSGPRGVALIPTFAVTTDRDGVVVNLYDSGRAQLKLRDGLSVALTIDTVYPADSAITMRVDPAEPRGFAFKLRIPSWCQQASARVNNRAIALEQGDDGYAAIRRTWQRGDVVTLILPLDARIMSGDHLNAGKAAIMYGPLVLAAEEALLEPSAQKITTIALPGAALPQLALQAEQPPAARQTWRGARMFRIKAVAGMETPAMKPGQPIEARLVPFADAGATGSRYRVWLPIAGHAAAEKNLLLVGTPSASASPFDEYGHADESLDAINDDNVFSPIQLNGNPRASEAWFAVTLAKPVALRRIVFAQGRSRFNGGWFDTSAGKPRIQLQRTAGAAWETVGELTTYPVTNAKTNPAIEIGRCFELVLPLAQTASGVRVIGVPACGNNPQQSIVSCGELQAFAQ